MDFTKGLSLTFTEPLAQMLRLVESGLKFCKQMLKDGRRNSFFTSNLKWLKIGYKYIKQPPKVVFGCFYMFTRFPIAKWHLTRDIMCQTRNIYVISKIFLLQKIGHMTQKTTEVI